MLQPAELPGQGLQFFFLVASPLCFLDFQRLKSIFSTPGVIWAPLGLPGALWLGHSLKTVSRGYRKAHPCGPPLSGVTGLGRLMSTVLKVAITYILASLGVVLGSVLNPAPAIPSGWKQRY